MDSAKEIACMKINGQLPVLPNQSLPQGNREETGFDNLLCTPSKHTQGGDYYLQHQNQLQESALTFKSLSRNKPSASIVLNPIEHSEINQESLTDLNGVTHNLAEDPSLLKLEFSTPITALNDEIKLVALIEKTSNLVPNNLNTEIINKPSANKLLELKTNSVLTETVFKNHQLYISDNTVELTINTTQLSKQETFELKKLIKQWLADKGLAVKQWIINGEPQ